MAAELRIFPSPADTDESPQRPCIPIRLREILPILAQAYRQQYAWLQDFLDEEIALTPDLFEILRSFRCYRPSA